MQADSAGASRTYNPSVLYIFAGWCTKSHDPAKSMNAKAFHPMSWLLYVALSDT
jgi:hypothetical protein